MLDHHLQRSIVYRLALSHEVRFSELKPDIVDSKLFTYHLKKVVSAGYVEKTKDGLYRLTPEGRRLGISVLDSQQALLDRADSVLFLVIRRKSDGAWLLYQRKNHPLIDRVGFMHCAPNAQEDSPITAAACCLEMTGLTGTFSVMGSGYFRVFEGQALESFTHFTLLVAEDATGTLAQNNDHARYFWDKNPDFTAPNMLPNMATLTKLYTRGEVFFVEQTLQA